MDDVEPFDLNADPLWTLELLEKECDASGNTLESISESLEYIKSRVEEIEKRAQKRLAAASPKLSLGEPVVTATNSSDHLAQYPQESIEEEFKRHLAEDKFLDLISEYPPLSKAKFLALLSQRDIGVTGATQTLIEHHLYLVYRVIKAQQVPRLGLTELLDGAVKQGLAKAVERYDPAAGVGFESYAHYWIRHAVHLEIASRHVCVRCGVSFHDHGF